MMLHCNNPMQTVPPVAGVGRRAAGVAGVSCPGGSLPTRGQCQEDVRARPPGVGGTEAVRRPLLLLSLDET